MKVIKAEISGFGERVEALAYDFKQHLAKVVVETTCNDVVFRPKKQEEENITPSYWLSFIDRVNDNNDINRLVKSDVKFKSLYGRNFVGFDIYDGLLYFWFGEQDNLFNESVRINDNIIFAVKLERVYGRIENGQELLRNQVIYTKNEKTTLFNGGLAASLAEEGKFKNKIKKAFRKNVFPLGFSVLEIPRYIRSQVSSGVEKHNYGVVPVIEFLNREVMDIEDYEIYTDWYNAITDMFLINQTIKYVAWETELNHTRVIGMVSQSELQASAAGTETKYVNLLKESFNLKRYHKEGNNQKVVRNNEEKMINKKLVLKSVGENPVQVMTSDLDIQQKVNGLNSLISLAFAKCGYSMNIEGNEVYENVSQTLDKNKGVYETTKSKVALFEKQWKEILCRAAFVVFTKLDGIKTCIEDVRAEFDKYIDFKIVSNVLQEQNNDWRKIMELKQNSIISNKFAIKNIFPELSNEQVEKMLDEIDEGETNNFNNSQFENQDQFGSNDWDKDNNDLALKGQEKDE